MEDTIHITVEGIDFPPKLTYDPINEMYVGDTFLFNLCVEDKESENLLIPSMTIQNQKINFSTQKGNCFTYSVKAEEVRTIELNMSVSDGNHVVEETAKIVVKEKPKLTLELSREIVVLGDSVALQLIFRDEIKDQIQLLINDEVVDISKTNSPIQHNFSPKDVGSYRIQLKGGGLLVEKVLKVKASNNLPKIVLNPSSKSIKLGGKVTVHSSVSDADEGDTLITHYYIDQKIVSTNKASGEVAYDFVPQKIGRYTIKGEVSDGIGKVAKEIFVDVLPNIKPRVQLSFFPQFPQKGKALKVKVEVSDEDKEDTLTGSVEILDNVLAFSGPHAEFTVQMEREGRLAIRAYASDQYFESIGEEIVFVHGASPVASFDLSNRSEKVMGLSENIGTHLDSNSGSKVLKLFKEQLNEKELQGALDLFAYSVGSGEAKTFSTSDTIVTVKHFENIGSLQALNHGFQLEMKNIPENHILVMASLPQKEQSETKTFVSPIFSFDMKNENGTVDSGFSVEFSIGGLPETLQSPVLLVQNEQGDFVDSGFPMSKSGSKWVVTMTHFSIYAVAEGEATPTNVQDTTLDTTLTSELSSLLNSISAQGGGGGGCILK